MKDSKDPRFANLQKHVIYQVVQYPSVEPWDPKGIFPSKIEWDLTNGPLSKLLELLDTQV